MSRSLSPEQAFNRAYEEDATQEATKLLAHLAPELIYHSDEHTLKYVYPEAMILAREEGCTEDELLQIAVIALYHDTGFIQQYTANEPLGAENAVAYAQGSNSKALYQNTQQIYDGVMTTNMQAPPKNKIEAIIRDADLSILGRAAFMDWSYRLREEILRYPESGMYQAAVDHTKWATSQLAFIQNHQWFTEAAQQRYAEQKQRNINLLRARWAGVLPR